MSGTFVKALCCIGAAALATLGVTGCGSGGDGGEAGYTGKIELLSWWYSASESRALDALVEVYNHDHPGVEVVNAAAIAASTAGERLRQRMALGSPPDSFQVNGGVKLLEWVKHNGREGDNKLEPLDDIAASSGWLDVVPRSILESVTYDGHVYAVPVNIHRANSLCYNKKIFAESGLAPPTTLDELSAVVGALAEKGITPLALSAQLAPEAGGFMWEHVFVMSAGTEFYERFFRGEEHPNDPRVRAALEASLTIAEHVNPDYESIGWADAARLVGQGDAAMVMDGDRVKAELQAQGYEYDVDFGMVAVGGDNTFVYVDDSFVLPRGAPHREPTLDLLATMGTVEGQDALNPLKGSIPVRLDTDRSLYDEPSQRAMDAARDPETRFIPERTLVVPRDYLTAVDGAYKEYLRDRDTDRMMLVIEAYYPSIKEYHGQE
ncbi:ABC transporter substrate-binding protein [Sorangium sp. So ce1128]